jgi:galactose mutarotase-like enzyme
MPLYTHERNYGCRVQDELVLRGLRLLVIENELVRITVLLDKGADIYEFVYKPRDVDFLWRSPLGLRPPMVSHDTRPATHGPFSDYYEGGWQECLPNGGRTCTYRGVELGQHGEVWGIPWRHQILEDSPECVSVRLWCRTPRSPYLLERTMTLRSGIPVVQIDEAVTNESNETLDLMWGHHPAYGPPFLDESCVLDCAAKTVVVDKNVGPESQLPAGARFAWPVGKTRNGRDWDVSRVTAPEKRVTEMTYLTDLQEGWYALTNQSKRIGVGMAFDTNVFRHLWCWQNLAGETGWPFWGRCYVMAVEPFSSIPAILTKAIEAGTQLTIESGQTLKAWIRAVAYEGRERVSGIDPDGTLH